MGSSNKETERTTAIASKKKKDLLVTLTCTWIKRKFHRLNKIFTKYLQDI